MTRLTGKSMLTIMKLIFFSMLAIPPQQDHVRSKVMPRQSFSKLRHVSAPLHSTPCVLLQLHATVRCTARPQHIAAQMTRGNHSGPTRPPNVSARATQGLALKPRIVGARDPFRDTPANCRLCRKLVAKAWGIAEGPALTMTGTPRAFNLGARACSKHPLPRRAPTSLTTSVSGRRGYNRDQDIKFHVVHVGAWQCMRLGFYL